MKYEVRDLKDVDIARERDSVNETSKRIFTHLLSPEREIEHKVTELDLPSAKCD